MSRPAFLGEESPVISPEDALAQCGDWSFIVELLNDMLQEESTNLEGLKQAIATDNHKAYSEIAHGIKGAALNMHLPGLADVSKYAEFLGKDLLDGKINADKKEELLKQREPCVQALAHEYKRLAAFIPEAQQKADEEAAGGGEEEDYDD